MSTSPGGGAGGGAQASWIPCGAEWGGGGTGSGSPNPRAALRDCWRPHQMRAWGRKTEDRAGLRRKVGETGSQLKDQ